MGKLSFILSVKIKLGLLLIFGFITFHFSLKSGFTTLAYASETASEKYKNPLRVFLYREQIQSEHSEPNRRFFDKNPSYQISLEVMRGYLFLYYPKIPESPPLLIGYCGLGCNLTQTEHLVGYIRNLSDDPKNQFSKYILYQFKARGKFSILLVTTEGIYLLNQLQKNSSDSSELLALDSTTHIPLTAIQPNVTATPEGPIWKTPGFLLLQIRSPFDSPNKIIDVTHASSCFGLLL
ncbi:MAG: hypothetical protein K1X29_01935 [Bdellovibrionales bacterium]|nr:hypothetical protein [Bdellovibrionales bacterium]